MAIPVETWCLLFALMQIAAAAVGMKDVDGSPRQDPKEKPRGANSSKVHNQYLPEEENNISHNIPCPDAKIFDVCCWNILPECAEINQETVKRYCKRKVGDAKGSLASRISEYELVEEQTQLEVLALDNVGQVLLGVMSLPSKSMSAACWDAVLKFRDCCGYLYEAILDDERELCTRLIYHPTCINDSNVTRHCSAIPVKRLLKSEAVLATVTKKAFCSPSPLREQDPGEPEGSAVQSMLDFLALQSAALLLGLDALAAMAPTDELQKHK